MVVVQLAAGRCRYAGLRSACWRVRRVHSVSARAGFYVVLAVVAVIAAGASALGWLERVGRDVSRMQQRQDDDQ